MERDIDAEYDALMDELEAAVCEPNADERGERIQALRRRIETMLREQMGVASPSATVDQRSSGPTQMH